MLFPACNFFDQKLFNFLNVNDGAIFVTKYNKLAPPTLITNAKFPGKSPSRIKQYPLSTFFKCDIVKSFSICSSGT